MNYTRMKYELLKKRMADMKLNKKQLLAYRLMSNRENVFITGAGGTGKSYVIDCFVKLHRDVINIGVTSTTGVSAILIKGNTINSYLGIGLGKGTISSMVKKIRKTPWLRKRWVDLDTLIIDEISMLDPELFDKLEAVARNVRRRPMSIWGGIHIILTGDFCQIPVVGVDQYCFEAKSWEKTVKNTVYLTENIRQNDTDFKKCLNSVRMGNATPFVKKLLDSRVNPEFETPDNGIKPTYLLPYNRDVSAINERELDILGDDGREFCQYEMQVKGTLKRDHFVTQRFIKNCPVSEEVFMCKDAQVMLAFNIDVQAGLVNGSRGVVIDFVNDLPLVRFANGIETVINYHDWELPVSKEGDNPQVVISQIPLKLAWAFTIHKSQGTTIDYAVIDLKNVWGYGMLYVALSRLRTLKGLNILSIDYDNIKIHPSVKKFYDDLESTLPISE